MEKKPTLNITQRPFNNNTTLIECINHYIENEPYPTPRHFRSVYLKLPKSTLSRWKTGSVEQQEFWNLIKTAEDYILAIMEQKFSYGGKEAYNLMFTLRAYDKDQYIPELNQQDQEVKTIRLIEPENKSNRTITLPTPKE